MFSRLVTPPGLSAFHKQWDSWLLIVAHLGQSAIKLSRATIHGNLRVVFRIILNRKLKYRESLLSVPWGTEQTTQVQDCTKIPGATRASPREIRIISGIFQLIPPPGLLCGISLRNNSNNFWKSRNIVLKYRKFSLIRHLVIRQIWHPSHFLGNGIHLNTFTCIFFLISVILTSVTFFEKRL